MLEVGPAHGFVAAYLRKFGVNVTTLDINKAYTPDVLASVLDMPFPDSSFNVILASEVLEHLPFKDFSRALHELHRVTSHVVFLSLPDVRHTLLSIDLKIPFLKRIRKIIKAPTFKKHVFDGQHYFEIGKRKYPPSCIRQEITRVGFVIRREAVHPDTPKNHDFVLDKTATI